jgi:endonuclease/exonuclease/phosphatase family metal-dependent hydrolase
MADTQPLLYRRIVAGTQLDEWLYGAQRQSWLTSVKAELIKIPTRAELYNSSFWLTERGKLDEFLCAIQAGGPGEGLAAEKSAAMAASPAASPAATWAEKPTRRIVMWNVLKGISFELLVEKLTTDERLASADILLLNEIDVGMARSENRHVAAALAARLGMYWHFVPSYLELTKGLGSDLAAPGENTVSQHGVAILSREKPTHVAAVPLPETFDVFPFHEKRLGQRTALVATFTFPGIDGPPAELTVGTAHLEVRGVPAGRAVQVTAILDGLARYFKIIDRDPEAKQPVIFAGDFNTHTFSRGTFRRSLDAFFALLLTPRAARRRRLLTPWIDGYEPLFDRLRERGYRWEDLNCVTPTAWAPVHSIEEGDRFGGLIKTLIGRLLLDDPRGVALHLDWFFGRQIKLKQGSSPQALADLIKDCLPSDHMPILVDLDI